jgi:hypothetical protein
MDELITTLVRGSTSHYDDLMPKRELTIVFQSDVRSESIITLQVNETHTLKDRVRLITFPISMLGGSDNLLIGEHIFVPNFVSNHM